MLRRLEDTFVGRERELAALARTERPCIFVHGPGGIGKSALLAEHVRRVRAEGGRVRVVDGRESATAQAALEAIEPGWLTVFDSYEEAPALGPRLRELLAGGSRLVIGSRAAPDGAWAHEQLLELPLTPLSPAEARVLVGTRGVSDAQAEALVAWGAGHALSLAVAADATLTGRTLALDGLDRDQALAAIIRRRIGRDELEGADHRIVAVAAIARAVDARLLGAVIDGLDGDRAESWLRSLSFAEPLGTRVTLHARMRAALATALAAEDPEEDRALRLRLADHLYGRITAGERHLWGDLVELLADPALRWGLAPVRITHRVVMPRPGDEARIATALGATDQPWWRDIQRWFREAPSCVCIVVDEHDQIAAWGIAMTPRSAPSWAHEDPVIGRWLEHAHRVQPDGDAVFVRETSQLPVPDQTPPVSEAVVAGNYHVFLASGLPSIRRAYGRTRADDPAATAFLEAAGYVRSPELDVDDPDRQLVCFTCDWGEGGMFRACRDLVYASLGAAPPAGPPAPPEAVRDALRSFHDPLALAASPLATGASVETRCASVRTAVRAAADGAFGESPEERLLCDVLVLGYLDPDAGHGTAMERLHVSRATYFRRLNEATDRIAAYLRA